MLTLGWTTNYELEHFLLEPGEGYIRTLPQHS